MQRVIEMSAKFVRPSVMSAKFAWPSFMERVVDTSAKFAWPSFMQRVVDINAKALQAQHTYRAGRAVPPPARLILGRGLDTISSFAGLGGLGWWKSRIV
jgi:hypothetical protein